MNLRILIQDVPEKDAIAVLKAFTDRVVKAGKLPGIESLSDSRPYVVSIATI